MPNQRYKPEQISPAMENPLSPSRNPIWEIVEQSAFLEERLGDDFVPIGRAEYSKVIEQRISAWRSNCAKGNERVFRKRLQWDGLDSDRAKSLVGRVRRTSSDLPPWARLLGQLIESSQETWSEMKSELASIRGEQPVAFEDFLYPFLRLARRTLQKKSGAAYSLLADTAHRQWERSLLDSLEAIATETLDREFTGFRTDQSSLRPATKDEDAQRDTPVGSEAVERRVSECRPPETENVESQSAPPPTLSRQLYKSFLQSLQGEGLVHFFLEYPVLARFLATRLSQWVDAAREFLLRLKADQEEMETLFHRGQSLGPVIGLGTDLSDRHLEGRVAMRAHFAAGVTVIYKPKVIEAESAYWNLLGWINRHSDMPRFLTLHVLNCGAYGWVEEIKPHPCQHQQDVEAFFCRAGMLLCLIYALEGTDCHHENLIAAGEHPVLIDHETLFQPRIRYFGPPAGEGPITMAGQFFHEDSVFRTSLLPYLEIRPSGESYDVSGLGGTEDQLTHIRINTWEHVNTDAMRPRAEQISLRPADNVVIMNGQKVQPAPYVDQIAAGFEKMYRFLQARGAEMLSLRGPLHNWSGLRFVFRDTWICAAMQRRLYAPRCLHHGMDASIELELLCRPLLYADERPTSWPILAAERRSLLQGDIPKFRYAAEGDSLFIEGGGSILEFFRESGFCQVQKRFATLSERDLERQLSFLRASFELQQGGPVRVGSRVSGDSADLGKDEAGQDDFLSEAIRIAHQIRRAAIPFPEGVSWNTLAYYVEARRWQLEPMTPRFYDGLCGVALFLAAVQKLVDEPELAALARSALATAVREAMQPHYLRPLFEPGIGAGLGQSSLIYAFVRASEFLKEEEWLHNARRFSEMLDTQRIASDRRFDLLTGAAGALLALLALYRAIRLPEVLHKAIICGEHLLQHRSTSMQGLRAWKTSGEEMLTGFSHGAAGIAYALLKLYEATGESSFREGAVEAEAYESSVFLPEVSNWPDFRYPPTEHGYVHQATWCHGAPGIALSRLAALSIIDTPQIREDISHGLRATRQAGTEEPDTVCCGVMGRVEAMVVAAKELADPACLEQARKMATCILRGSRLGRSYALGWEKVPYIASFHQGMAGIGYEFLRLAFPGSLPSLLLWE